MPAVKSAQPGVAPAFDIDDPVVPKAVARAALGSGGYPYTEAMKRKVYNEQLEALQIELLKLARHIEAQGERLVITFDGWDAAGKGGMVKAFAEHMNPRHTHHVALAKPNEVERGQWYFQRFVAHLPTAGDITLFERSWYNRAGVERVMGFCTPAQAEAFLRDVPAFEAMLVQGGVRLVKVFLEIGREMQLVELHERRHDPLKRWKLTEIDLAALTKRAEYETAFGAMLAATHSPAAPWVVARSNDKRRARLAVIRHVLAQFDYADRDSGVAEPPDAAILHAPAVQSRDRPLAASAAR